MVSWVGFGIALQKGSRGQVAICQRTLLWARVTVESTQECDSWVGVATVWLLRGDAPWKENLSVLVQALAFTVHKQETAGFKITENIKSSQNIKMCLCCLLKSEGNSVWSQRWKLLIHKYLYFVFPNAHRWNLRWTLVLLVAVTRLPWSPVVLGCLCPQ